MNSARGQVAGEALLAAVALALTWYFVLQPFYHHVLVPIGHGARFAYCHTLHFGCHQ